MASAQVVSVGQWRRCRLVKAVAIWFVLLIVLPFTAFTVCPAVVAAAVPTPLRI